MLLSRILGTETSAKSPDLFVPRKKPKSDVSDICSLLFPACSLVPAEIRFVSLLSTS